MEWLHLDSRRRHLLLLVLVILPLYAINGRWGPEGNLDTLAVGLAANQVTETQSLDLSEYDVIVDNVEGLNIWFVRTPDGQIVSNRAPGLIALAIPSYYAFRPDHFTNGPATTVALVTTMLALVIVWNLLIGLVSLRRATLAVLVLGLGTTTWTVSSAELWPHGPGQLWAAIGLSGLSSASAARFGLAYAASITTRPITAVIAATGGILEAWRRRSWAFAFVTGLLASAGLGAVLAYNKLVFGTFSIRGGYGASPPFSFSGYLSNVFEMFVGLPNGVLVTTPIIGLALIGAIAARSRLPGWSVSAAFAGLIYLLVHAALNSASADAVIFYRYPLEAIVLATPALAIGATHIWDRSLWGRRLVAAMAAASVAGQFVQVFYLSCVNTNPVAPACILS